MDPRVACRKIAAIGVNASPQLLRVFADQRDSGADAVAVVFHADEFHLHPMRAPGRLVQKQARRTIIVGHEDVDVAVIIDVAECGGAADFGKLQRRALRNS